MRKSSRDMEMMIGRVAPDHDDEDATDEDLMAEFMPPGPDHPMSILPETEDEFLQNEEEMYYGGEMGMEGGEDDLGMGVGESKDDIFALLEQMMGNQAPRRGRGVI